MLKSLGIPNFIQKKNGIKILLVLILMAVVSFLIYSYLYPTTVDKFANPPKDPKAPLDNLDKFLYNDVRESTVLIPYNKHDENKCGWYYATNTELDNAKATGVFGIPKPGVADLNDPMVYNYQKKGYWFPNVRYVRIGDSDSDNAFLKLSQIVITNEAGKNIARGKTISSSSPMSAASGNKLLIDGFEACREAPNFFSSRTGSNAYVQIDLGSEQDIYSVIIYQPNNNNNNNNHNKHY
jgi:hypothetical protein